MTYAINGVMLALGSSPAALIVAKATLIAAAGLIAAWLARRSRAALRHALLAVSLAALLALPIAAFLVPPVRIAVAQPPTVPSHQAETFDRIQPDAPTGANAGVTPSTSRRSLPSLPPLYDLLLAGWFAGTALLLSRMLAGLWQVRRLRQSGLPWRRGQAVVERLAPDDGISRYVEVLLHESLPAPVTCGFVHPAILLPPDAQVWDADDLNRAILHELEHVRRWDWLSHCLARAVCAAYWFHPLVWIAWRQLALEAERSCDDAVLRRSEATDYADQLVNLAQRLSTVRKTPALAMANRSDLSSRVRAVLDSRQRRGRAGTLLVTLACLSASVAVVAMSPLRMVAAPQQPTPTPGARRAQQARPVFEVASVKPSFPAAHGATIMHEFSNGSVSVEATTYSLIETAFGVRSDQMSGGPNWIFDDYYSVIAKADHPAGADEMWHMMVPLLEERFHLKVHREKQQLPVYKLSLASAGLKLRQGACASWEERTPPPPPAPGARFALPCGKLIAYVIDAGTAEEYVGGKVSMSSLAEFLTKHLGHPVVDETGYKGTFDIDVKLSSDEMWGRIPSDPSGLPDTAGALRELGIKLERVKGPVEVLVIDSISRPDPN